MGAPTGSSGVHCLPNMGQSWGFFCPVMMAPAMQAVDSPAVSSPTPNRSSAS